MRILIDESQKITLDDATNFSELAVLSQGPCDPVWLTSAVSTIGYAVNTEHIFLDYDALPRLAGSEAHAGSWQERYDGMVAYAREHGWTDSDGAIRAHVEWTS
jgi:hypothetical protein